MTLLQIDGLEAGYGAQSVLRGLDLAVEGQSFAAIVGPNGHGKTTLLRAISGLIRPSRGTIRFKGQLISQMRPDQIVAAGIVHVPQGDMLFPEMTVVENLRLGAYLPAAAAKSADRMEEVFALLPKLRERRDQTASTLSGGERRMVGIGRGLMAGGDLLMLDEPSLGLAPIIIDQIYDVIQSLAAKGRSILVVEENAVRIAGMADRMHLLDNGCMVWGGPGAEFLQRPEILAAYLGG